MSYAFVVAASQNYIQGLTALLNSIEKWHGDSTAVIILSLDLDLDTTPYSFPITIIDSPVRDMVRGTAIERFRIAYEQAPSYSSICLLDADMFLTANVGLFFKIAEAGFIVTGSNGMIINFNRDYQKKYGVDLGVDEYPYPEVHTTAPIFISARDTDWFKALYDSRRIDQWDDFLYLNLLGIKMGKDKKMVTLPPYSCTGIHHFQLKPATAVFKRGELLLSGTEERVLMVHGKWFDPGWLQDLMPTMERYLHDEDIGPKGKQRVEDAIDLLKSEFGKYVSGC